MKPILHVLEVIEIDKTFKNLNRPQEAIQIDSNQHKKKTMKISYKII